MDRWLGDLATSGASDAPGEPVDPEAELSDPPFPEAGVALGAIGDNLPDPEFLLEIDIWQIFLMEH